MAGEKKFAVHILSDPGNEVAERYGIRFKFPEDLKQLYEGFGVRPDGYNGDASWKLPMPTLLIIDRDGIIRYAEIPPDYPVRPDLKDTIEGLNKDNRAIITEEELSNVNYSPNPQWQGGKINP